MLFQRYVLRDKSVGWIQIKKKFKEAFKKMIRGVKGQDEKKNDFMDINGIENIAEYIKSPKFIENFCYITTKKATFELLKLNNHKV